MKKNLCNAAKDLAAEIKKSQRKLKFIHTFMEYAIASEQAEIIDAIYSLCLGIFNSMDNTDGKKEEISND